MASPTVPPTDLRSESISDGLNMHQRMEQGTFLSRMEDLARMRGVPLHDVLEELAQTVSVGINEIIGESESLNLDVSNEVENGMSDAVIGSVTVGGVTTEQPDRNSASSAPTTRQPVSGLSAFSVQFGYASAINPVPRNQGTSRDGSRLRQAPILRVNEVAMNTSMHDYSSSTAVRGSGFGGGALYPSIPRVTSSRRISYSSLQPVISMNELLSLASSPPEYSYARYSRAGNARNSDSGSGANQTSFSGRQILRQDQRYTSSLLSRIGQNLEASPMNPISTQEIGAISEPRIEATYSLSQSGQELQTLTPSANTANASQTRPHANTHRRPRLPRFTAYSSSTECGEELTSVATGRHEHDEEADDADDELAPRYKRARIHPYEFLRDR